VVVCTYTDQRWTELAAGARAVVDQLGPGDELILVVDHNPDLLERVRAELPGRVVPNAHARGLSGGRNTGVEAATGDVVAFLDDDALPSPGWVAAWRARFTDPGVVAAGGAVEPSWEGGVAPRWFPPEFGWVVGCDYAGLPPDGAQIRNPIGASMAVRRGAVTTVGGFSELVGRIGTLPVGCEETELSIRLTALDPAARIVRDAGAHVRHLVPRNRQRWAYFLRRCFHEGRSKRQLSALVGSGSGLASERTYVRIALPRGLARDVTAAVHGDAWGAARAAALVAGLLLTALGYALPRRAAAG
jgi:glycosyltransferase involved in cell wall biosynthesis